MALNSWSSRLVAFLKHVFVVAHATIRRFSEEEGMHMAAGIAYYALFSVFPLALLFVSIFSYFIDADEVIRWTIDQFGEETAVSLDFLESTIEGAADIRGPIGILGIVGTILSSTLVFSAIMRSINRAWGLVGTGTRTFWRRKLWELGLLGGLASLFILSFLTASVFEVLRERAVVPGTDFAFSTDNAFGAFFLALVPFIVTTGILLLLYKFVPTTEVKWHDVWPASLVAAAAYWIANKLLSWYIGSLGYYNAVYGSLTSVIVLLLWVYICANILIIGAAMSSVLANLRLQSSSSNDIADS